ncbi:membrane hypothetical protein [uncultured Gammaproteobacteria bacterium]
MTKASAKRDGINLEPPWAARRGVLGCWLRLILGLLATGVGLVLVGFLIALADPTLAPTTTGVLDWLGTNLVQGETLDRLILTGGISAAALVMIGGLSAGLGPWLSGDDHGYPGAGAALQIVAPLLTALPLALLIRFAAVVGWNGPGPGPLWFEPGLLGQPWTSTKLGAVAAGVWLPALIVAAGPILNQIRRVGTALNAIDQRPEMVLARVTPLPHHQITRQCRRWLIWRTVLADLAALAPKLVSAVVVVSVVLDLPTLGPGLVAAVIRRDFAAAGWTVTTLGALVAALVAMLRMVMVVADPTARDPRTARMAP